MKYRQGNPKGPGWEANRHRIDQQDGVLNLFKALPEVPQRSRSVPSSSGNYGVGHSCVKDSMRGSQ